MKGSERMLTEVFWRGNFKKIEKQDAAKKGWNRMFK
jgi:hypothetical protein